LTGTVYDSVTGITVSGVRITLRDSSGAITRSTSGSNGIYTLNLNQGTYKLETSSSRYNKYQATVTIVKGQTTTLNISLKPKSTSTTSQAIGSMYDSVVNFFLGL